MPGNPERHIYKLYPQLQGKSVFIVDSPLEKNRLTKELADHLTSMQLMRVKSFDGLYFEGNLLKTIEENNFDVTVFHVAGFLDERNVLEAQHAGKKIIVLKKVSADNDLLIIYQNLRKAGVPNCLKMGSEFEMTRKITDLLAKVFTSPSQT
ncbi:hypothetical protein KKE75_03390 [Patescibacteria group bacterium]|nr:hypothetical protein [Patescibacteria group bacterium]